MHHDVIEQINSSSCLKLRHVSQVDIPTYIGGSKSPDLSTSSCPLHCELLSKTEDNRRLADNSVDREAWLHSKQEMFGDKARKILFQELLMAVEAKRQIQRQFTKEELYVMTENEVNHSGWNAIRSKIRTKTFQLEPTMYEDFIIL